MVTYLYYVLEVKYGEHEPFLDLYYLYKVDRLLDFRDFLQCGSRQHTTPLYHRWLLILFGEHANK